MPQSLVYILLLFALALPVLGAIVLRVLSSRLAPIQLYGAAAVLFGIALVSVGVLARGDVPSLQIGGLSVLLPVAAPEEGDLAVPEPVGEPPAPSEAVATSTLPATTTTAPTAEATSELPAAKPTAAPPIEPTAAPTAEPTAAPTAEPTPEPTAAPAAPAQRTYTVQAGDTLRSIAEQFGVSVTALVDTNRLTSEQADSLRVGQELVIP
jgi:LysM repeat protein